MKLRAEIEGEELSLELKREGARLSAEVGGRTYMLEARAVGRGEYLLIHEGRVYECRAGARQGDDGARTVSVGPREYAVKLTDPKRLRGARASAGHGEGRAQVVAAMPGKVVRVLVEQGQKVEAGAGVLVVEAMKMQNEMKSPKAGTVTELHARVGATVNAGDVLAVIE
jgi:biotin carboxyl carrier protein